MIKQKIFALSLVVALAVSMTGTALAGLSPAGIDLSPSTTAPEIRPGTDPDFPESVAGLSDGLCFGTMALVDTWLAGNFARNSATDHNDPNGREIGLRVMSAINFNVQVDLTGFQVGSVNTLVGAYMQFTATGATPVTATGASGGYNRVVGGWQSLPLSVPNTFTLLTPNIMSGTGTTPGSAVTIVEGREFAGVTVLWARNLVAELNMVPFTAGPGEARATMTWTAVSA